MHQVETEDGYLLCVHRIKSKVPNKSRLGPVFFLHGLIATAADFIVTGPDKALRKLDLSAMNNPIKGTFFLLSLSSVGQRV